ncbi:MAG: hypothetical protein F6K22_34625 [Okeania sp. SIO2F4]|uniref:hypothetical protein n=1 Tax=Okeania sp. SIO2F4 TaxID=2607790 RepID=UPI00142CB092|nr:hypothetical protein [Okeania sp. SIO2F4]NES07483.1 hypothetical protein [Okeania sp. SIO2F4]
MVYSKKEYLAREQDAPTAVPHKKHCRTMHDHYNAPPPKSQLHAKEFHSSYF